MLRRCLLIGFSLTLTAPLLVSSWARAQDPAPSAPTADAPSASAPSPSSSASPGPASVERPPLVPSAPESAQSGASAAPSTPSPSTLVNPARDQQELAAQ